MNKKLYLPILLIAIVACTLIPFSYQKIVTIDYPFMIVFNQLKAANWKKWQPQLLVIYAKDSTGIKTVQSKTGFSINAKNIYINAQTADGFKFAVTETINHKSTKYKYVTIPQSNAGKCSVIIIKKGNTYNWLLDFIIKKPGDIDALKSYMYDTKAFYGYQINRGKVIDSNIVVQKQIVPIAARASEIVKIQQLLNAYLKLHGIKQEQPIMADIRDVSKDSALVMIGIPIVGRAKNSGDFKFMHLPRNGYMLSAYYRGPYGGRQKLYKAIKAYVTNHSLSAPEVPYEKFMDNKIPLSDADEVNMQVNFPIF